MKSNTTPLKEAITDLLNAYNLSGKLDEHRLLTSWEKTMGKMIARHTKELYIKDRVLTIRLDSSVLREELAYAKSKMIKLLNDSAGKEVITDIIFR